VRGQQAETPVATGDIAGVLVDPEGRPVQTGQAVVFLCDGETGMPLAADARGPFDVSETHPFEFSGYCHAVTNDIGVFSFDEVPAGVYRLVAQSWEGITGMAGARPDGDDGPEPSSTLLLHGVAENVEVKAGAETSVVCRRAGDGVLRLVTDPEEPHNSALTVVGLAEGARVHVSLFNYDNSVGTGGGEFVADGEQARLPIYAYWSNGKFEPPPRLVALVEALEAGDVDVEALTGIGASSNEHYLTRIQAAWSRAAEEINVPGFGAAPLIDVLAAEAYRHLRRRHAGR
jgi:hypothetical protein